MSHILMTKVVITSENRFIKLKRNGDADFILFPLDEASYPTIESALSNLQSKISSYGYLVSLSGNEEGERRFTLSNATPFRIHFEESTLDSLLGFDGDKDEASSSHTADSPLSYCLGFNHLQYPKRGIRSLAVMNETLRLNHKAAIIAEKDVLHLNLKALTISQWTSFVALVDASLKQDAPIFFGEDYHPDFSENANLRLLAYKPERKRSLSLFPTSSFGEVGVQRFDITLALERL